MEELTEQNGTDRCTASEDEMGAKNIERRCKGMMRRSSVADGFFKIGPKASEKLSRWGYAMDSHAIPHSKTGTQA